MGFLVSPAVAVREFDLSNIVPAVSTAIGAIAGEFNWGPVGQRVLISNENEMVARFGKPNIDTAPYFFSAASFLSYAAALWAVRVVDEDTSYNASTTTSSPPVLRLIKNESHYLSQTFTTADPEFLAKYPGDLGNHIGISICGADQYDAWIYKGFFNEAPAATEVHIAIYDATGEISGSVGEVLERFEFLSTVDGVKFADGSNAYYREVLIQGSRYVWPGDDLVLADINRSEDVSITTGESTLVLSTLDIEASETSKVYVYNSTTGVILGQDEYTVHDNTAASPDTANTIDLDVAVTEATDFVVIVEYSLSFGGGVSESPSAGEIIAGYNLFADGEVVDVNLIISGPANETIAEALIDLCETRKDCVVYLSPRITDVVNNFGDERADIIAYRESLPSTSYAFLDSGWKYMYDRYNDVYRWVPLNGDMAGLTARTDFLTDPWFSPAGFNRGQIKNSIRLAWNPETLAVRDELYKKGVNPVMETRGNGTILFGDKTLLARPSAFDRINVRRLFIVLEKAIATASKFQLFELNDEFTRAQFRNMIEPFLRDVQGRRGIYDFRVICDDTNNTAEVIDRNEFVADIYVKPARSINFIFLNFIATRSGISFDETVGNRGDVVGRQGIAPIGV